MAAESPPFSWPDACSFETAVASPTGVGAARRAAIQHFRRWGCTNVDDAVLVLSELVTNAVLHAGGAHRVVIGCHADRILISVHDHDPAPARLRVDAPPVGGRGLHIVARLSDRWGCTPCEGGKETWAVLPAASASGPVVDRVAGDLVGACYDDHR